MLPSVTAAERPGGEQRLRSDPVLLEGGKPLPVASAHMWARACARVSSQLRCSCPGLWGDAAHGAAALGLPGAVGHSGLQPKHFAESPEIRWLTAGGAELLDLGL